MATATNIQDLRVAMGGDVLEPGDPAYDDVRAVQNGMIDRRPAVIARCLGSADIATAVQFARAHDLEIAVRGGGHNVAGRSVCDDGLMIDLSLMRAVLVDPVRKTAIAQGGATWGDFNRETQLHGLATTGGVVSTTGVGGLTVGGGLGWLMGSYGLTVDNLLSAEVVTASGEVIRASASSHPDLFWAIRGGGGNFGVVSAFEFQLHPVGPMVVAGFVAHPIEAAPEVLRFYREYTANAPDELTAFAALLYAPDDPSIQLAAIVACHSGSVEEGEAAVRPLKEFGTPALDIIQPMPYAVVNTLLDDSTPKGALNYWKSNYLEELTDEAIDTMVEQFRSCPSPLGSALIEHFHGAATRVAPDATAFPHRREGYNFLVAGLWLDPRETDANVAWTRAMHDAMRPFMASGQYSNYQDEPEPEGTGSGAYGENYARLQAVKAQYDPENVFHLNVNVQPAK